MEISNEPLELCDLIEGMVGSDFSDPDRDEVSETDANVADLV